MVDSIPEDIADAVRRLQDAMRKAQEECDIHVTVEGTVTPLRDCDWVLRAPCGHVYSIMSAVCPDVVYPDAESAWHDLYDIESHPHRRVRIQQIKHMRDQGYTVVALLRDDAVEAHRRMIQECDTACRSGRSVDTVTPPML